MEGVCQVDLCSAEFSFLDELNQHFQRHEEEGRRRKEKQFKCNLCAYEFSTRQGSIKHTRTHPGERPFKCKVIGCGRAFTQESTLKNHIAYKHSHERPFKCDFPGCLHTDKVSSDLRKHKKLHSDERPFACANFGCNYKAKTKKNLSEHIANVHKEFKALACSTCQYRTNNASNLRRHMIVHEGRNEKIPCSIEGCKYKGKNSRALELHVRRHKILLPCPVSDCGQYFATTAALKDHYKFHIPSGRTLQCPLCFKHYPTLIQLQKHCFVHTNEKPFQCGHCAYAATTRAFVKRHIASAHATLEFPFVVHLLDDRECLRCNLILPSAEFVVHCKGHVEPELIT